MIRQERIPGDEVLVIGDGYQARAERLVESARDAGLNARYVSHGPTRNFGNAQRTFALGMVHGDYVSFLDDDDVYAPEAFTQIRKAIVAEPGQLFFFKTVAPWGEVVWTDAGVFEQGNICTVQMVVLNRRPFPPWGLRQGANVQWARQLSLNGKVAWRREITTICRPLKRWWE